MKLKDPELKKGSFLSITLLILSGELIFLLPYVLARVFRPTFLEVFNLTNLQLGGLFSVYGVVAILSYMYGGVISDKFQPKVLIAVSLFFTALGGACAVYLPILFNVANTMRVLGFYNGVFILGSHDKSNSRVGRFKKSRGSFRFVRWRKGLSGRFYGDIRSPYFFCFFNK